MNDLDILFSDILEKKSHIAIIGMGYVGLPLAVRLAENVNITGYDIDTVKIHTYKENIDSTNEIGSEGLKECGVYFTSDENDLDFCKCFIICVPTPIYPDKTPDLRPLLSATKTVSRHITKGSVVIYESTVYPGVTEDKCIPVLEKYSGLILKRDFKVGYSPERINPGDREHSIDIIKKVVSGIDSETVEFLSKLYSLVTKNGTFKAESIKIAEAAKVIENTQRDINIAFINELSIIFNILQIDTLKVLETASTKWNFLSFKPGLVGGHCIGVDPYYLTYNAIERGYYPDVILAGRRINDNMGRYIAENTVKKMISKGLLIKDARILILGITFKENISDIRNSKVFDIINTFKDYGINVSVIDPYVSNVQIENKHGITLIEKPVQMSYDAVVIAVPHDVFTGYSLEFLSSLYRNGKKILIDVKGMFCRDEAIKNNFTYWRL